MFKTAVRELGTKEISGSDHNARILEYAHAIGMDWVNDDETPWCSIFINWCARQAQMERSGSAMARSWLDVGTRVTKPNFGDLVIFSRAGNPYSGHVGIYTGMSQDGAVYTLGGNQRNMVGVNVYSKSQVLGFRRLSKFKSQLPHQSFTEGSKAEPVKEIQRTLNWWGYSCGPADGIFGRKTRKAIEAYQYDAELDVTGSWSPKLAVCLQVMHG